MSAPLEWAFHDRVVMSAMMIPFLAPHTRQDTTKRWRRGEMPRLLDACTGFIEPLLTRTALERGWQLTVCDINPQMPDVVKADVCGRLPWDDGEFQGIVSTDTMEHVPDPAHALKEFSRVTSPGGFLILGVPVDMADGKWRTASEPRTDENEHKHLWYPGLDMKAKAQAAGYELVGSMEGQVKPAFVVRCMWFFVKQGIGEGG